MPIQARGEFAPIKERLVPALELSGQPVKRGTMAHKHIVYMMLVDTAAQQGDEAALREFTPLLEELAVRDDHRPYLAIAHRAWGVAHRLAGEFAEAEERFKQALGLFEDLALHWQIGRTQFALGELALASSDKNAANEYFSLALASFEQMGAIPYISRTRAELETLS